MGDNHHSVCSVISKSSVLHVYFVSLMLQIEDLNQQAQMAAAEKFRDKPPAGPGDLPSTVAQPIQEESEEEEEVKMSCQKQPSNGCKTTRFSCLVENGVSGK